MLGSVHDAEDPLQDAFLRAWRGLQGLERRSSLRAWLYRIATNACLDAIARRPKRVLPIDYGPPADPRERPGEPLAETIWVGPYPDERLAMAEERAAPDARHEQREALELAFVAALHLLARSPARGAGAPRGARVLGSRGRPGARNDRRGGEQRPAARTEDRGRAVAG